MRMLLLVSMCPEVRNAPRPGDLLTERQPRALTDIRDSQQSLMLHAIRLYDDGSQTGSALLKSSVCCWAIVYKLAIVTW